MKLQGIILVESDLRTLTDLRRVNRRAMEVVDTLPEYRSILQNSPVLLRASLSIEMGDARHATPADLEACQQALAKLHNLGVLHGDVVECNILITSKGVTLINFPPHGSRTTVPRSRKRWRSLRRNFAATRFGGSLAVDSSRDGRWKTTWRWAMGCWRHLTRRLIRWNE